MLVTLIDELDKGTIYFSLLPSSKSPVKGVFDVNNIETTGMPFTMSYNASTTHVAPASDHDDVAGIKFHKVDDFVLLQVELDGVIDPNERIGIADSTTIVGNDIGDAFRADGNLSHF